MKTELDPYHIPTPGVDNPRPELPSPLPLALRLRMRRKSYIKGAKWWLSAARKATNV